MEKIKILIANKYFLMNYAIRCILQAIDGFEVHGASEEDIPEEVKKNRPDIVIIEIDMIRLHGFEFVNGIKKEFPGLKIIALADIDNYVKTNQALKLKLDGYLSKGTSEEELIQAAKKVFKGEKYFGRDIQKFITQQIIDGPHKYNGTADALSKRETEILELIIKGKNTVEIANKLFISETTVLTHRRNVMRKLKVRNSAQLILAGIKSGIVNINE